MGDSPAAAAPPPASGDLMALRYQRLVLLNRMSVALFGDKPLAAALPEACHADKRLSDEAARRFVARLPKKGPRG